MNADMMMFLDLLHILGQTQTLSNKVNVKGFFHSRSSGCKISIYYL